MKDKKIKEIAKEIDPDDSFLDECDELLKWRFGKDYKKELRE